MNKRTLSKLKFRFVELQLGLNWIDASLKKLIEIIRTIDTIVSKLEVSLSRQILPFTLNVVEVRRKKYSSDVDEQDSNHECVLISFPWPCIQSILFPDLTLESFTIESSIYNYVNYFIYIIIRFTNSFEKIISIILLFFFNCSIIFSIDIVLKKSFKILSLNFEIAKLENVFNE